VLPIADLSYSGTCIKVFHRFKKIAGNNSGAGRVAIIPGGTTLIAAAHDRSTVFVRGEGANANAYI